VELPDPSPLELANQVATKVKQHARPWRAIIALVLAVGAGSVAGAQDVGLRQAFEPGPLASRVIWGSMTVAFCFLAVISVVGIAGKSREVLSPRTGTAHAAVVRYTIMLIGAIIIFITILALLKIPVTQLLVGGAVTTIFIGIAAQQSLGNVFAGVVLLFSRPFQVGDAILLRSGALGGQITGTVTEIGLTYVLLDTGDGIMHLPNSQVLAAGVGQVRPQDPKPPSTEPPTTEQPITGEQPTTGRPGAIQPTTSQPTASPPTGGPPSGDAPGSGGRPLSPPGL
jgi:small-conductance mechanosensitive channel